MNKKHIMLLLLIFFSLSFELFAEDIVHVLQKGETLYSIGRLYNVPVDTICALNSIADPSKVAAGHRLIIKKGVSQEVESSSVKSNTDMQSEKYMVVSGDTLYGIARRFSVSVDDIKRANGFSDKFVLKSGQYILIPAHETFVEKIETNVVPPVTSVAITDPRIFETKTLDNSVIWPIKASELHYLSGKVNGVLLTGKKDEKISCIASGTVLSIGPFRGFGQVVFVKTPDGYIYVYSGLDSVSVKKGQWLNFGDSLGLLGLDKLSGKPQLNLMVYNKDIPMDPAKAPRG